MSTFQYGTSISVSRIKPVVSITNSWVPCSLSTYTHTQRVVVLNQHSMFAPHLNHHILQFIRCFPAADVDVELARRDDEFHKDSHQAPSLQWW